MILQITKYDLINLILGEYHRDKIDIDTLNRFLDRVETFMSYINIYSPGLTEKMLTSSKVINKKKN